jgi:hypothetical protein
MAHWPYHIKRGGKFHYEGLVTTSTDESLKKIIKNLGPVLLSAQNSAKIIIPPLPRMLFNTCCSVASHCENFADENYAEKNLGGVSSLRSVIKKECTGLGVKNRWVLDGIGALIGTPIGQSYGTNREVVTDLRAVMAPDGVHLDPSGKRNLSKALIESMEALKSGNTPQDELGTGTGIDTSTGTGSGSGFSGAGKKMFFWRGFTSPVGDIIGRAALTSGGCRGRGQGSGSGIGSRQRSCTTRAEQYRHRNHPYGGSHAKKKPF